MRSSTCARCRQQSAIARREDPLGPELLGGRPGPTGPPSAAGFIWPVHGVLTSGFGWRWGRMHAGIDLAVAVGTPVVAAAAGTVIVAGWLGGYGNLVVIDHGNGIATAYGHNTSVTVGVGQSVAQGQLISYSGSTGHSTGPHVHFEVRDQRHAGRSARLPLAAPRTAAAPPRLQLESRKRRLSEVAELP